MRLKALFCGLTAAILAAQPIAATAAFRAAPATQGESELGGDSALLGVLLFAAIVAGFYLIAESDGSDDPVSA